MATRYTTVVQVRGGGRTAEDAVPVLRSLLGGNVRQEGDAVLVAVDLDANDTSEAEIAALDRVNEALAEAGMPVATAKALDTRTSS